MGIPSHMEVPSYPPFNAFKPYGRVLVFTPLLSLFQVTVCMVQDRSSLFNVFQDLNNIIAQLLTEGNCGNHTTAFFMKLNLC